MLVVMHLPIYCRGIGEIDPMGDMNKIAMNENRIKTCRWLFYVSLFQLLVCFALPVIIFPVQVLLPIEILIALTLGLLFGLYFLGVNIYGVLVDKSRRPLYLAMIVFVGAWTLWTVITWLHIEHMAYLT